MNHRIQWFIESLLATELPCLATALNAVPHVDHRDFGDKLPIGIWIMIIYGGSVRGAKSYSDLDREYLAKCQVPSYPISCWEYLTVANRGQLYPDTRLITQGKDPTCPFSLLVIKAVIHLDFASPQLQGHLHMHEHMHKHMHEHMHEHKCISSFSCQFAHGENHCIFMVLFQKSDFVISCFPQLSHQVDLKQPLNLSKEITNGLQSLMSMKSIHVCLSR